MDRESKGTLLTYWNNFVPASEFWLAENEWSTFRQARLNGPGSQHVLSHDAVSSPSGQIQGISKSPRALFPVIQQRSLFSLLQSPPLDVLHHQTGYPPVIDWVIAHAKAANEIPVVQPHRTLHSSLATISTRNRSALQRLCQSHKCIVVMRYFCCANSGHPRPLEIGIYCCDVIFLGLHPARCAMA